MDHNKRSRFIIPPIRSLLTEIFHCPFFLSVSLVLQATEFPFFPCQRGQGKFSSWLPSLCMILWGVIPHWTDTHMHTNRALCSLETIKVCLHDSWFTWTGVGQEWGWKKKVKCKTCFLLDKRQQQQHFSAAGRRQGRVLVDQPKVQECDFSYEDQAELWALIPDWRESRIFRHSEWQAGRKGLGAGKSRAVTKA